MLGRPGRDRERRGDGGGEEPLGRMGDDKKEQYHHNNYNK